MALSSAGPPGPATATAMGGDTGSPGAAKRQKTTDGLSPQELMIRLGPHQLPAQDYVEPF
jgi:hypothetical protein